MSINKADIDFAFYVLDQAIYTHKPLSIQDCALIKKFIEALLEHKQQPSDNVKSREWRSGRRHDEGVRRGALPGLGQEAGHLEAPDFVPTAKLATQLKQ